MGHRGRQSAHFHLREDAADAKLTDLLEVHVVESRKLKAQSMGMEGRLAR